MKKKTKSTSLILLQYTLSYKWLGLATIFFAIASAWASTYRPKLISHIIDYDIPLKDISLIQQDILLVVGIIFLEVILQFVFAILASFFGQNIIKRIRDDLYSRLIYYNLNFFNKTPLGVLVTRTVSDIETIATVFSDGLMMIFGDVLRIVFVVFMMYSINWQLGTAVLCLIPIMIFMTRFFQSAIKKTFQNERNLSAQLNTFIQEHISGMYIVQIFNQQKRILDKFKIINEQLKQAYIKTVYYFAMFFPASEVVSSIAIGLIIIYGMMAWNSQGADVGEITAFILYVQMLFRPMRQIANRFNNMQRGLVGAERVIKLGQQDEWLERVGAISLDKAKGNIVFDHINFAYIPGEPILRDLSFEVKQGQMVALVGTTGAGKSTIINLLTRFYDVTHGCISLDGIPIQELTLKSLRRRIGLVSQDVFLFNDSILNNIRIGNERITEQEVVEAAQEIGIHDFISSLPNGYHYQVKERGATLSVGQRQLISFLRIMVYQPDILILDEATSSIDTQTERLIQEATSKLTQGRTSIVIAHRLATIQEADEIMVMHQGSIIEKGTHDDLLKKQGYYFTLYQNQFSEKD